MKRQIGVGVIGVGILGKRHARVYSEQPGARLVALADHNPSKAQEIGSQLDTRLFSDYGEMLTALGPNGTGELDAVTIATPDFAHFEPVRAALESGIDVFVEKPLTMNLEEAKKLVALANENSRVFMVNYSQRWLPEYEKIVEYARKGGFGNIAFIQAHRWDAAWVPQRMISWANRSTPIHFMSSHDIDLILHWLEDKVDSVSAVAHYGALTSTKEEAKPVDGFGVLLHFAKGVVVSLHSSWILPSSFPQAADSYLEILGSKGAAFLTGSTRELRFYGEDRTEQITFGGPLTATEVQGRLEGAFTKSLQAFLSAVETRRFDAPTSAAETLHVVQVQEAILKAATTGQTIKL